MPAKLSKHPIKPTADIEPVVAAPHRPPQHHPPAPHWPSYTGTSQFVGTSQNGRVTVYVDPSLGQPGLQNAHDLVNDADRIVAFNDAMFGTDQGSTNVIIFALDGRTDGTGGADHMGCDYTTGAAIEVCASFGSPARVSGLFEAELSECNMNNNLCGESTGEALSRWCAMVVSNNALPDFVTAPTWFQDGMPDFVNQTDPTDRSAESTGCGMAFLSWLLSQGHALHSIAQTMVSLGDDGTLAQLYASLTGDAVAKAWPAFKAAVQAIGPIANDDPFGGMSAAHQVVASVHGALGTSGLAAQSEARAAMAGRCNGRSRRLLPTGAEYAERPV